VRQDGPPFALDHQIPHRRNRLHAASFVRDLRVVRHEMELSSAVTEAALLDLMAAHKKTHLVIDAVI
jgi:hypothetical protein